MIKRNENNYYVVDEGDNVANVFADTDWDENGKYIPNGGEEGYDFSDYEDQIVCVTTSFEKACEIQEKISYGEWQ